MSANYLRHDEYDSDGKLAARYESFEERSAESGATTSGRHKYDQSGQLNQPVRIRDFEDCLEIGHRAESESRTFASGMVSKTGGNELHSMLRCSTNQHRLGASGVSESAAAKGN